MTQQTTTDVSRITPPTGSARDLLQSQAVIRRFETVLGDPGKAALFVASLASLVYASKALKECDTKTIIAAAIQAAAFDVPIDPALGFAYLIPYNGQARFQPGWKLYVQLAHRTNQYRHLHVTEVCEGEVRGMNRMTGLPNFGEKTGDKVIGYLAYFELINGFQKYHYMTVEELRAHGEQYSKTYNHTDRNGKPDSKWKTDFPAMAKKTVLKTLLSKWGPLSVQLNRILRADTPPDEPETEAKAGTEADRHALFGEDDEQHHAPLEQEAAQATPSNAELDKAVAEADAKARPVASKAAKA